MKKVRSKRVLIAALALLLALFLVRPQIGILQRKVAASLSAELGRPVEIASVHIRFLPRPGLELENLIVHDSGDFGPEPLVRSADVNAWLRVSSLFRGRIEISSLSLSDASLNLSRNSAGKWNIEDLLERSSRSSTAPTASGRKETRREFPYIEGDRTRINFKNGVEKTHFAFTNAEFAVWQDSENQWGMRLRGSPIRTDANLTDTGTINISGTWQRSAQIENTPIQLSWEWKQAQIGQVSKLLTGFDHGWRGGLLIDGTFTGTLDKIQITSDVAIDQFRRQDVLTNGNLQAVAHCTADYASPERTLKGIDCNAHAGEGTLAVKGTSNLGSFSYELTLLAKDVPAQATLDLARHVNQSIPADLRSSGAINGTISLQRKSYSAAPQISGSGEILGLRLASAESGTELPIGTVPLRLGTLKDAANLNLSSFLGAPEVQIGPVGVALGRPAPVQAQFVVTRSDYKGSIRGEAGLKRLQQVARMLHAPLPEFSADGVTSFNLALSNEWKSASPAITGTAELHSVRAQVRGVNVPLLIHRADLSVAPDSVRVTNLDSAVADTTWRGSIQLSRPCAAPAECEFQFHLRSPQVSAASLNQILNPAAAKHPWYKLLALSASDSFFSRATANGSIAIDKLMLGGAACTHFSADVGLRKSKLSLSEVRGTIFAGRASGAIKADFSLHPPAYSGLGSFEGASLEEIATLTRTKWAEGSASAHYQFTSSGANLSDLLSNADLKATFTVEDGVFPHVVLTENSEPLHPSSFAGDLELRDGQVSFENAKLQEESGVYLLSGTASLNGALKLKMTGENSGGYALTGTLAETRVSPLANPPTQAELKP